MKYIGSGEFFGQANEILYDHIKSESSYYKYFFDTGQQNHGSEAKRCD